MTLASYGTKQRSDINVLQVGDILLNPGSHVALVEDVVYQNGKLTSVTIIEQTPPIVTRTVWGGDSRKTLASFQNTYLNGGYSIYRSNKVVEENKSSSGIGDGSGSGSGSGGGSRSDCIECGVCETRCPYHLPIRKMMKECAEQFGE